MTAQIVRERSGQWQRRKLICEDEGGAQKNADSPRGDRAEIHPALAALPCRAAPARVSASNGPLQIAVVGTLFRSFWCPPWIVRCALVYSADREDGAVGQGGPQALESEFCVTSPVLSPPRSKPRNAPIAPCTHQSATRYFNPRKRIVSDVSKPIPRYSAVANPY